MSQVIRFIIFSIINLYKETSIGPRNGCNKGGVNDENYNKF